MKHFVRFAILVVLVVVLGFTSCSRPPTIAPSTKDEGTKERKNVDVWKAAFEQFRYPDNPSESDDWTRFRAGLQSLDPHLAKSEVLSRLRLSVEAKAFLEKDLELSADELAEVESTSFRTADAHYLDECFLLRDASAALNVQGLAPSDQARQYFHWVMRAVLPHEQGDSNTPPAFTLRRGFGSPLERSMVFLALLRQANIEGCLIVVPEKRPLQFLVGVRDQKSPTLWLYDTRLGLPVTAANGKGIATLDEIRKQPELAAASLLTPSDIAALEAWLVCPLYALAPRLQELQKRLSPHGSLVLHMDPIELRRSITDAVKESKVPVKTWKANQEIASGISEFDKPAISPTRWLRSFVPKQDGGIDETRRVELYVSSCTPIENAAVRYMRMGLTGGALGTIPAPVYHSLLATTQILLTRYDLNPREMLLRGNFVGIRRRSERLNVFITNDRFSGLYGRLDFRAECEEWITGVRKISEEASNDPNLKAKVEQHFSSLWMRDELVRWLIEFDKDKEIGDERKKPDSQKVDRMIPTKILAAGIRDYLDLEHARLNARINQEKADRTETTMKLSFRPSEKSKSETKEAWEVAKSSWANYYLDRTSVAAILEIQQRIAGDGPMETRISNSLLEKGHLDVQKYINARLRLAECIEMVDGPAATIGYLKSVKEEIQSLEKKGKLKEILEKARPRERDAGISHRLALLARDWIADTGSYAWMVRQIDHRIAILSKN